MNRTLLIVAAGPLQVPAFEEARAMGIRTVAVDANPSAPGMSLADAHYAVDILDHQLVTQIARREQVHGVMTLCTDAPVRTVAQVASQLNLKALSSDAAANATDKRLMRRSLASAAVPIPRFFVAENLADALQAAETIGFPLALKAPCSSGSRGVVRVESARELASAFNEVRRFQPNGSLLLEEWMEGPEVSVEGACTGHKVRVVQVTDKAIFSGPFPVEAGHTQPSMLPSTTIERIRSVTNDAISALGLSDCAFHAELKITSDGPKVVEIGARLGGDRIATHLTPLSTGVNLLRAAIMIALSDVPDLAPKLKRGAAVRYFHAPGCGVIERIDGLSQIESLPGLELLYAASERDGELRPGLRIGEVHSSLDRYGHVLFSGEDAAQASERAEYAASLVRFHFLPGSNARDSSFPNENLNRDSSTQRLTS
jgi:biotin carboxylase